MKTYKFLHPLYGGKTEEVVFRNLPDTLKFYSPNTKQTYRYFLVVVPSTDTKTLKQFQKCISSETYKIGGFVFVTLSDVQPVSSIPTITFEELQSMYNEYLYGWYIKHVTCDQVLISIHKILGLSEYGLKCVRVGFNNNVERNLEDNSIEIGDYSFPHILHHRQGEPIVYEDFWDILTKDAADMFNERVNELIKIIKKPYLNYHGIDPCEYCSTESCEGCSIWEQDIKALIDTKVPESKNDTDSSCEDTRFWIIQKAKEHLLKATNIKDNQAEMQVLDSLLFKCWQMGWLKQYEL